MFLLAAGLGLVSVRFAPGFPPWIVAVAGGMFVSAGAAMINNSVFYNARADTEPARNASVAVRFVSYVLSLATFGLMCSLFAWISLGSGERHFNSWVSLGGHPLPVQNSERFGRIAFGVCAAFLALLVLVTAVSGARSLRRR